MKSMNINTNLLIANEKLRMIKMQRTTIAVDEVFTDCQVYIKKLSVWIKPESKSGWVLMFWQPISLAAWWRILVLTYTLLHVNIPKIADRPPYGSRLCIGRCFHIQTPAGACTICDHARKICWKTSGFRTIIKFAGYLQVAEIVPRQFYLWQNH